MNFFTSSFLKRLFVFLYFIVGKFFLLLCNPTLCMTRGVFYSLCCFILTFNKFVNMDLHYGNISKENLKYLEMDNVFTKYFNKFNLYPYPTFIQSCEEIEQIQSIQSNAESKSNWESISKFCEQWDSDLMGATKYWLSKLEIPNNKEYIEYLAKISEDMGGLIMQLKNYYNRARPYQYAYYSNRTNFNPYETLSGNTPAYPSGHAGQSHFILSVVANHYEEKKDELMKLAKRIADSRVVMGVHFPSDNAFGIKIANDLMEEEDIKKMYF